METVTSNEFPSFSYSTLEAMNDDVSKNQYRKRNVAPLRKNFHTLLITTNSKRSVLTIFIQIRNFECMNYHENIAMCYIIKSEKQFFSKVLCCRNTIYCSLE